MNKIRGPGLEDTTVITFCTLHAVADLLEELPGIEPVRHKLWEDYWRPRIASDEYMGLERDFTRFYRVFREG